MKGVSEIIAIILILMIVVALAALAYTWFSGIFSSLTATTSNATTSTSSAMTTNFRIEIAKNQTSLPTGATAICSGGTSCNFSVTIRGLGTTPIDVTKISAYINDSPAIFLTPVPTQTNLVYGNITTFYIGNTTPWGTSARIRIISATGLEQTTTAT
jgi:flagellin-like protein